MNKLDAINLIITNAFLLKPLATDDNESSLYNKANQYLNQSVSKLYMLHNDKNIYFTYTLKFLPNNMNEIILNDNYVTLSVNTDKSQHYRNINIKSVKRNGTWYLYNDTDSTFEFDYEIYLDVSLKKDFDELTLIQRYWVAVNATLIACYGEKNEENASLWVSELNQASVALQTENINSMNLNDTRDVYYGYKYTGDILDV